MTDHPRVFISYAQESADHADRVLALANRLRHDGVEAIIDRYFDWVKTGWRAWMSEQIESADWVLVVCTEEYRRRFDGKVPADAEALPGRGVRWESQHITQELYDHRFRNRRFVPLLPPGCDESQIPLPLRDSPRFALADGDDAAYEALYRLLTGQPATPAPELGELRRLAPLALPAQAAPSAPAAPPREVASPYPGLAAFPRAMSRYFFARERDTQRVVDRLRTTRFVSLVGGSGTGKSSLVAAGVAAQLEREHGAIGYLRFKPQSDPTAQLAEALDRLLPEERSGLLGPRAERLAKRLGEDPARALASSLDKLPSPLLLFADQFEELFTQTPRETATRFRALFAAALEDDQVRLVLTLRSEFMGPLMDWLGGELFERSLVPLEPIADQRLSEIVVGPAKACGVAVEAALVERLSAAGREMSGALPLLALVLKQLFDRRDPAQGLTLAAYEATGGLGKIVETAAAPIDEAIDADPALARACERLFGELATVVDDLPTRRTARVAALRGDPDAGRLVEALRAQGFLADPDEQHVELAHETLLEHWERLHRWCQRCGDRLALRREAEQAAADWQKARHREEQSPVAGGLPRARRRSDLLRWTWERQKPALEALLALHPEIPVQHDPRFADPGIDAWRSVSGSLGEPLSSFLYPEPLQQLDELESDATPHHRREEIGLRLNQMGDPRRGVGLDASGLPEIDWVDVEPGEVTLEADPPLTFAVAPFAIARYPVTWRQYLAFVEAADGYRDRRWWTGLRREEQPGAALWAFDNYPAINVSWYDAVAFCRWLNDRLALSGDRVVRLPTECEWQWAAQAGDETRKYPWSGDWQTGRCNSQESGINRTIAAGLYPLGAPERWPAMDLCGNVWEWCLNRYGDPADLRLAGNEARVLRGGSWIDLPGGCRAAALIVHAPVFRDDLIGFRVCLGSPIGPLRAAPLATVAPGR